MHELRSWFDDRARRAPARRPHPVLDVTVTQPMLDLASRRRNRRPSGPPRPPGRRPPPAPRPPHARCSTSGASTSSPRPPLLPRGQQVLDRWPDAERVEVASHWNIPELHGDEANVDRWVRIKTEALVLGVKKSLAATPNGRSSDFIAPSTANGCAMACAYCYVPRRKGYSNPITVFANIEQITGYLCRHVGAAGRQARAEPVRPARVGLRPRREQRLLGRRDGQRQRARPRRPVPRPADREGVVRDEARQPRPARLGPAGPHPRPLLAHARPRRPAGRRPHVAHRRPDRRDRRLRRGRLRGAPQLQPGHRARRLARGLGRAARPGRGRHRRAGQGAAGLRGHHAHPQRGAARGQPRLAPEGRGGALAARPAAGQALASPAGGTSATAPATRAGTSPRSPTSSPSDCRPAGSGTRSERAVRGRCPGVCPPRRCRSSVSRRRAAGGARAGCPRRPNRGILVGKRFHICKGACR